MDSYNNAIAVCNKYKDQARRAGMSRYNERMNVQMPNYQSDKDYASLSSSYKNMVDKFLYDSYIFGMGTYQERGAGAQLYDRLGGTPPNPARYISKPPASENEPQPGE